MGGLDVWEALGQAYVGPDVEQVEGEYFALGNQILQALSLSHNGLTAAGKAGVFQHPPAPTSTHQLGAARLMLILIHVLILIHAENHGAPLVLTLSSHG